MEDKPFKNISVAIVEDDDSIREGIASYLDSIEGFICDHVYPSCEEALKSINSTVIDVVLMDIHLQEGISGIEGTLTLKTKFPEMHIIILTVYEDDEKIFSSLRAGASGYLLKKSPLEKIASAIKEVYDGGAPMTPVIAKKVLGFFDSHKRKVKKYNLTKREMEILNLLVKGFSYKMICGNLFISIDTVRSHIKNIYEKLQVNSKSEAVAKAFKDNLI